MISIFLNIGNIWSEPIQIPLITYHTHAPFIIGNGEGLTYDLAEYLNDSSNGLYQFEVLPMSRLRLNKWLEEKSPSIIPWVVPAWFNDIDEKKYIWADGILLKDGISYISNVNNIINKEDIERNGSLVFGGIRGHNYSFIDPLVQKGIILRQDSDNHIDNFRKLVSGRIDFSLTPMSSATFLVNDNNLERDLYIANDPNSYYSRRVIINHQDLSLKLYLDELLTTMKNDPAWNIYLARYINIGKD